MSQAETQILARMKVRGTITARQASRDYGIDRLAPRILDLKAKGHRIDKTMIEVTKLSGRKTRVAEYYLVKPNA